MDRLFAKAVLKAGLADKDRIVAGARQLKETPGLDRRKRLPDILIERGVLTRDQVTEMYRVLNAKLASCPECGLRRYVRIDRDPNRLCKECRRAARERGEEPEREEPAGQEAAAKSEGVDLGPEGLPHELAHLRILRRLGGDDEDGLYKAFDTSLDRIVALRMFSPALVRREPHRVRDILNGARATARIDHGSLVRVQHVGMHAGWPFIEMEFVDGVSLERVLRARSPLPESEAVPIIRQVAQALQALHAAGLVHGHLTPGDILVNTRGRVKLTDVGVTTAVHEPVDANEAPLEALAYMPPETIQNEPVDARSDVYALGLIFWRAAVGRLPFDHATRHELIQGQCWERMPDPCDANPRLSRVLGDILSRMLAKRPAARQADAAEFLTALDNATGAEEGPRLGRLDGGMLTGLYPITREPLVLGRDPNCGLTLRDERASRRHSRVQIRDKEVHLDEMSGYEPWNGLDGASLKGRDVVVEDLQSSNGTYVNTRRITRQAVLPGDIVRAGGDVFIYLVPGMPFRRKTDKATGWLRGQAPDGATVNLPLSRLPILIGRAAEADIQTGAKNATDFVMQITAMPDGVQALDLTGPKPGRRIIRDGQQFTVCGMQLTYSAGVVGKHPDAVDVEGVSMDTVSVDGLSDVLAAEARRLDETKEPEEEQQAPQQKTTTVPPGEQLKKKRPSLTAWSLTARSGPIEGKTFQIGSTELLIGSHEQCGIPLPDSLVSKQHARIIRSEGTPYVEDLDSKNGVFVNGKRVRRSPLKPGDTLKIGSTQFLLHL